jgi:hypothetical protein
VAANRGHQSTTPHELDPSYGWESRKGLMIKRGDRVKLTAGAAAAFKRAPTGRRGVVERITTNKANAVVLWDGRISTECVPIRSIEPVELG